MQSPEAAATLVWWRESQEATLAGAESEEDGGTAEVRL